jgi:hypothetical protein
MKSIQEMIEIKKRFDEINPNKSDMLIIMPNDGNATREYILCRMFDRPIYEQAEDNTLLNRFNKKYPLYKNFSLVVVSDKKAFMNGNPPITIVNNLSDYIKKKNLDFII